MLNSTFVYVKWSYCMWFIVLNDYLTYVSISLSSNTRSFAWVIKYTPLARYCGSIYDIYRIVGDIYVNGGMVEC